MEHPPYFFLLLSILPNNDIFCPPLVLIYEYWKGDYIFGKSENEIFLFSLKGSSESDDDDDDDDDDSEQENLLDFFSSPMGMIIVGGSIAAIVGVIIFVKKRD